MFNTCGILKDFDRRSPTLPAQHWVFHLGIEFQTVEMVMSMKFIDLLVITSYLFRIYTTLLVLVHKGYKWYVSRFEKFYKVAPKIFHPRLKHLWKYCFINYLLKSSEKLSFDWNTAQELHSMRSHKDTIFWIIFMKDFAHQMFANNADAISFRFTFLSCFLVAWNWIQSLAGFLNFLKFWSKGFCTIGCVGRSLFFKSK